MKILTALTVAVAAALIPFAAISAEQSGVVSKSLVSQQTYAVRGVECPYLFGCDDKEASIPNKNVGARAAAQPQAPYHAIVAKYAAAYNVPVSLAHAVITVESNYRPDARGSAGEIGLMQIKPATARMMGYSGSSKGLFNPDTNIKFGMKYLSKARELSGGTTCGTILKYNAGHAAKRMNNRSSAYCAKVKRHMAGT